MSPRKYTPEHPNHTRAPNGSSQTSLLLRMTWELRLAAEKAAERQKIALSEWIRRALEDRLGL